MTGSGRRIGGDRGLTRLATGVAQAAALAAVALAFAGCQSMKDVGTTIFPNAPGLEATLRPVGSAASGTVRVFNHRDGVALQLAVYNLPMGNYRIALHERGNCSSPNLFSAGSAWAPAGSGRTPQDLLPPFSIDTDGDRDTYVAYISGARTEGPLSLRGKSVVIHFGSKIDEAIVGQRNNRVACGVLGEIKSPF